MNYIKFLKERFKIEKLPESAIIVERGDIWLISSDFKKIEEKIKFNRVGIRLIRVFKDGLKLTSSGAQLIGQLAKKNVLTLNNIDQAIDFISGKDIKGKFQLEEGQVIVKFKNDILGVGLYKDGKIKNQIPKSRRIIYE